MESNRKIDNWADMTLHLPLLKGSYWLRYFNGGAMNDIA